MRSKLAEMQSIADFQEFMERISNSANYFVAKGNTEQQYHALDLCLAYAFEAGMNCKIPNAPGIVRDEKAEELNLVDSDFLKET